MYPMTLNQKVKHSKCCVNVS